MIPFAQSFAPLRLFRFCFNRASPILSGRQYETIFDGIYFLIY